MLSDPQKRILIQTVREQLRLIVDGDTNENAFLGFHSACIKLDFLPDWFVEARKADKQFDAQCRGLEDTIVRLVIEKAVGQAATSKDRIRDLILLAERMDPKFAPPARPQIQVNKNNSVLMWLQNADPSQVDAAIGDMRSISKSAQDADNEMMSELHELGFVDAKLLESG